MKTGKAQGYVLTFRCINCGKYEVFAKYPTEEIEPEDQSVTGCTKQAASRVVGMAMLAVSPPFVFRIRRSSKRGLRDRDLACDRRRSPETHHRQALAEGSNLVAL
jgi:hypothetical protein